MKKVYLSIGMIMLGMSVFAQSINFSNGQVTYNFPATTAGEMPFSGNCVTVADRTFDLSEWSIINVNEISIAENTVEIGYSAAGATVNIAGNIAKYIDATVDEGHVGITQSD